MSRARPPERGALHVYLGLAPGVGKTYAMLEEGVVLASAGLDVVAGWVETHGRRATQAMLETLERVPPRQVVYRDATFEELDLEALVDRRPHVALVDELAHTNVSGSRHDKRWQDVEELLQRGVGVITSVNVQHLESLETSIELITGARPRETVPDALVSMADRVDFVDVSPDLLRRRVAEGVVLDTEAAGVALGGFFNAATLTALRDLGSRWLEVRNLLGPPGPSPFLEPM
jgi:two-component system sensor histidine kinase KdpD